MFQTYFFGVYGAKLGIIIINNDDVYCSTSSKYYCNDGTFFKEDYSDIIKETECDDEEIDESISNRINSKRNWVWKYHPRNHMKLYQMDLIAKYHSKHCLFTHFITIYRFLMDLNQLMPFSLSSVPISMLLEYKDEMERFHYDQLIQMIEHNNLYQIITNHINQEIASRHPLSMNNISNHTILLQTVPIIEYPSFNTSMIASNQNPFQSTQNTNYNPIALTTTHNVFTSSNEHNVSQIKDNQSETISNNVIATNLECEVQRAKHLDSMLISSDDDDLSIEILPPIPTSSPIRPCDGDKSVIPPLVMNFKSFPWIKVNLEEFKKATNQYEKKKHKCCHCTYSTVNSSHLTKHLRIHSGDRPFGCNECGKCFKQKSNLKTHQRTHLGLRPYICHICYHRFTQKSSLVQHEKIHSGIKPFVCAECCKTFKRKDHLQSHQRMHSGDKPEKCNWIDTKDKVSFCEFVCDENGKCIKEFATSQQLKLHYMDHTGIRPFPCDECGKAFKTQSTLKRHKRTHLKIKPFNCDVCNKGFLRRNQFNKHKEKCVQYIIIQ